MLTNRPSPLVVHLPRGTYLLCSPRVSRQQLVSIDHMYVQAWYEAMVKTYCALPPERASEANSIDASPEQDISTGTMALSALAPAPGAATVLPPPSSDKSGVDTVAFQGAMSALGVLVTVGLCFIFSTCRKRRNRRRSARRFKDRQQHQRPAKRPANAATEDDTTVHWEAQEYVSQHVSYQPESATGTLPKSASETSSGAEHKPHHRAADN